MKFVRCSTAALAGLMAIASAQNFTNPVLWDDLADLEVIRVGDTFYYTASTMHYSPGAPVLRSYDLVHWEYVSHSVPTLEFGPQYYLNGSGQAYVHGIWASSLHYRPREDAFYWLGCTDFDKTYIYRAGSAEGPWAHHATIDTCYYDAGLLFDDNDDVYVAYGSSTIHVAQLNSDLTSQLSTSSAYVSSFYIEGSRMYQINGTYYIAVTRPPNAEFILRSTTNSPWGPYEIKNLVDVIADPVKGSGAPHQGGLVDTQNGDWYYMGFIDAYPGGRIPVLAPVVWSDGWPTLVSVNGTWGAEYPLPVVTDKDGESQVGTDSFKGGSLSNEWEWNHNPDNSAWRLRPGGGLMLRTATVTTDLYAARNTLTHRIRGPASQGTFRLSIIHMADGDRAGSALLRDLSAYVGVWKDGGVAQIVYVDGLSMNRTNWSTSSNGTVTATGPTVDANTDVWFRVKTDIAPAGTRLASFYYSLDGHRFTQIGDNFTMTTDWHFFMGHRYSVFNYATKQLGGSVLVKSFTQEMV